jgi:hypothetical protein
LLIVGLLRKRDRLLVIAQTHRQRRAPRRDRQIAITEPADEIERLSWRLLLGQPERVLRDVRFDRRPHLRCGAEKTIGRRQTAERLMRSLEIVVLHEERDSARAVVKVREDRP